MAKHNLHPSNPHVQRYLAGNETFRRLFIHWMDTNRWTHPAMIRVCNAVMGGLGWLHSSQISDFRSGKTSNPGPRVFIAISELNNALHIYKTTKKLIPGTKNDSDYLQAYAIAVDGMAPRPEWWMGVFAGCIDPVGIPIDQVFHDEAQAEAFSGAAARSVRKLMAINDLDIICDLDLVVHRFYPAGESSRSDKLKRVLLGKAVWSKEEAEIEIPALIEMTTQLGDSDVIKRLLQAA